MSSASFRSVAPDGEGVTVIVDGAALTLQRGRSLLAALLLSGRPGAAADFFCAIGQCQRCVVTVDGRPGLACLTVPKGGEIVSTPAADPRPPPWS
jgi:aerobic-type carbon monoxide dehydrogenase small subunit (CoxS/CutS family)